MKLTDKIAGINDFFAGLERVVVALSGGVDSSVLLKLAALALTPDRVHAVTLTSVSATAEETALAEQIARLCGVTHQYIPVDELAMPEYTANPVNRCYYCQRRRFQLLKEYAVAAGYEAVLDGSNQTDQGDYRPGQQALKELGILSPLKDNAFTKEDLRQLAKLYNLPNWNRPSNACLSSRVPYGIPITKDVLIKIAAGEELLRGAGFTQCRLRHHGDIARLEVPSPEFDRILASRQREKLIEGLKGLGYAYITLDLQGYRTGSLNEGINEKMEVLP